MKKTLLAAAAALVTVGVPAAFANPPTTTTIQDNFTFADTCTGESVQFTGTTTISVAFSQNNNTAHTVAHVIERDDGVGLTSGASYALNANENATLNQDVITVFPAEENIVVNAQVIGQGAVANESIKESFHITINADGTVTVARDSIEFSCHG